MMTARLQLPWRKPSAVVVDVVVTAVVAFPTLMDAWWNEEGTPQADWITMVLGIVSVAALLVRRRWPFAVTIVCAAALTGWNLRDQYGELLNLPTMVGLYTIAAQGNRRTSVIVGLVAAVWSGALATADPAPAGAEAGPPVLETVWPFIPLMLGEVVRSRRELLDEYARRAELAEAERELEARHRVAAERLRIAREFHDVVAHTMAAVNVQMSVAEAAFDRRPDAARDAIGQARASSKEALQELRAAIAMLRGTDSSDDVAPAPRLVDITELADGTRVAGIAVTLIDEIGITSPSGVTDVAAAAPPVTAVGGDDGAGARVPSTDAPPSDGRRFSAAVEQAAYRIVQEALTNVVRHSGASHVAITLRTERSALVVEVSDDGHGPAAEGGAPSPSRDGGFGLRGMNERAAALGGTVSHGPGAGGGFVVRAELPTEGDRR